MDPSELQAAVMRVAMRAVASRHRHVFRYEGPSEVLPGRDVFRCTRCPRMKTEMREAS